MIKKLLFCTTFLLLLFGISCKNKVSTSNADKNGSFDFLSSKDSGITFSNNLKDTKALNIVEYLYYYNGGGVAVGDINNDGLEDVYFTGNQVGDKLYINKGNLKFEDVTSKSGIKSESTWSTGVSMDDVNGDGHLDIYVCKVSPLQPGKGVHNLLYINDGKGLFTESSKAMGLDFAGYSTQSAWIDYDKDGDLDMYLLNHTVHSIRSYGDVKKRKDVDPISGDRFFENRLKEEGKFVDVTNFSGIYSSPLGYGLAITVGDINNDGWTDIYVGNDFHENDYLYLNTGKKGFREVIGSACTHMTQFSMGADLADIDGDGWLDLFSTDMMPYDAEVAMKSGGEDTDQIKRIKEDLGFESQHARNHMQLNQQDGTFADMAYMTQTFATDWSWAVLLQDFDNNGMSDVFITNGIYKRPNDLDYINYLNDLDKTIAIDAPDRSTKLIEKMPSKPLKNFMFYQKQNMRFSDIHSSMVGPETFSNGAAYSDIDNDGDLDILVNNINAEASLMVNTAKNNHVGMKLTNNSGLTSKGATVHVWTGGKDYYREHQTTKGFLSSTSHKIHIGLGDATSIDSIVIKWPDGGIQTLVGPKINTTVKVVRDVPTMKIVAAVDPYKTDGLIMPIIKKENKYIDENQEKLIPERLSADGPAFIYEDLTGDGISDIFIGGPHNEKAELLVGQKGGRYTSVAVKDFETDARYEDIAATTIDFDGDGDRDLYVVSGGNDSKELDKLNEDRLYLNNGNGDFRRIPLSLPHTNGSSVAVADFDKDGYEDIFVGARSIPGSYGLSPYSFILKNKGGAGVDVVVKSRLGMVTDAAWGDIDGDGYQDLVVVGDWMAVTALINNGKGQFVEKTSTMGLDKDHGLWNTVTLADVNSDGRLDILAGNIGLNHKWQASHDKPMKLYVDDFDGNGISDPVIFYTYHGRYVPFGSLDRLASHLPLLKKKFNSYAEFSKVTKIEDLFPEKKEILEKKKVTEMRSMVYINQGGKTFKGTPMGEKEQRSDIKDIYWTGGEVYYAGNGFEYVAELGRASSNSGRVLSKFDTKSNQFGQSNRLNIPVGLNGRRIVKTDDNKKLVISNQSYMHISN